jgi:glycosyltransferase involved in cell wall biosynthesis
MIVKDEEKTLSRCLDGFKTIADEIIIVDTGSADETKRIAGKYTDKIYDFVWADDFSAARNFSYSKATGDYIMWCDADDVLTEENAEKLQELKRTLTADTVMMKYISGNLSFYRERITKRSKNFVWREPVHEHLEYCGDIIKSDIEIVHLQEYKAERGDRNLKIYEKQKTLSARGLYYYARELFYKKRFKKSILIFNKFLRRPDGWVEDRINAFYHIALCYFEQREYRKAAEAAVRSFALSVPRGEAVCLVGLCYKMLGDLRTALFWYNFATTIEIPDTIGFVQTEYYNIIPAAECAALRNILTKQGNNLYTD